MLGFEVASQMQQKVATTVQITALASLDPIPSRLGLYTVWEKHAKTLERSSGGMSSTVFVLTETFGGSATYSPPQEDRISLWVFFLGVGFRDRIWLWVYYNKIPIYFIF